MCSISDLHHSFVPCQEQHRQGLSGTVRQVSLMTLIQFTQVCSCCSGLSTRALNLVTLQVGYQQ